MKGKSCNSGLLSPSPAPFQTPPLLCSTAKPSVLVLSESRNSLIPKNVHIPHWTMPNLMVK